MSTVPVTGDVRLDGSTAGAEIAVSGLFTLLWDALAEVLGTAATATLLKRAGRRASARSPELAGLAIQRQGLAFTYTCPARFSLGSLRGLIGELRPLLIEMTGQVVVRHLEQIAELRERGLLARPGDSR